MTAYAVAYIACPPAVAPPDRAAVALTAQLDYERAKGRLEELNAVADLLPAALLQSRRRLRLEEVREAGDNWLAARAELAAQRRLDAEFAFEAKYGRPA